MSVPRPTSDHSEARDAPPALPTFAELYAAHAAFVWRVVRRLGVAERDVEDVCQETFMVVHRRLPEFAGRSSVKTWLYGIAFRCASAYRRRVGNRHESPPGELPEPAVPGTQEDELSQREARQLLDRALDHLDDDKRAVFILFELEGLAMKDVAEMVSCPLQTAYSRLHAARRQVQHTVERFCAEEPQS